MLGLLLCVLSFLIVFPVETNVTRHAASSVTCRVLLRHPSSFFVSEICVVKGRSHARCARFCAARRAPLRYVTARETVTHWVSLSLAEIKLSNFSLRTKYQTKSLQLSQM